MHCENEYGNNLTSGKKDFLYIGMASKHLDLEERDVAWSQCQGKYV